jgi:hypothetical protein
MKARDIERCAKEAGMTRSEGYGGWLATDSEMVRFVEVVTNDYAMQADEVREALRMKRKEESTEAVVTMAVNAERERIAAVLESEGWMAAATLARHKQ